jgi:hypothetical protein
MKRHLVLIALFSSACVDLTGELPEACLTQEALTFPGVPISVPETRITEEFVHEDLRELQEFLGDEIESEITFLRVAFVPKSGVTDLSFIKSIEILGNTADGGMEDVPVSACQGSACPVGGARVFLPANDSINIRDYVKSGSMSFGMTVGGDLPKTDWSIDVDICVHGTVSYGAKL